MATILQCPVCHDLLLKTAGGCQCANKHTFDAARQGYVNFLLAHKKHSKEPGDSPEMVQSRRRFLDRGFYDAVSAGINETIAGILPPLDNNRAVSILDAGCGEGFYLKRLKEALAAPPGKPSPFDFYGIDISKFAVRQATQRDKSIQWFVASIIDLPFVASSLDIVLNVFSPAAFAEFARVLRDDGKLVIAAPGPKHLNGLRESIYPVAREHGPPATAGRAKGLFSLAGATRVTYPLELKTSEEIMDLLAMTPYFWNIDQDTKAKVEALDRLQLDVDVLISVYSKTTGRV